MKRYARFLLVIVPGACAFFGYYLGPAYFQQVWSQAVLGAPKMLCPSEVVLGELELGSRAVAKFTMTNGGRQPVEIAEVATTCACNGLELDRVGPTQRLTTITLAQGESLAVRSSFVVRGRTGEPAETEFILRTNDPQSPVQKVTIKISRVTGGTNCKPTSVVIGPVGPASGKLCYVDLFDGGAVGRKIASVESSMPHLFTTKFLPLIGSPDCKDGMCRLGQVEVRAIAETSGHFKGSVLVFLAGENREPDQIPVVGTVVRTIDPHPNRVVLPVRTGMGWSKEVVSLVRHRDGQPFELKVEETPPGWTATIDNGEQTGSVKRVVIRISESGANMPPQPSNGRILLKATMGDEEHWVNIAALYLPSEMP